MDMVQNGAEYHSNDSKKWKNTRITREGPDGEYIFLMREYVQFIVIPMTDGTGVGYALLINKENPL